MGTSDESTSPGAEVVRADTSSTLTLFGRADALHRISEATVPVLVLTGDSGVGKSELLRALQAKSALTAPPPITVRSSDGSLQRALLEGLASATAELVNERGLALQVGERLVAAGRRLVTDRGKAAGKVLVGAVLAKVKDKVGADTVDIVAEFIRDIGEAGHETLLARINAATDPDVADLILELAAEVAELAGNESPIIIALDGVEDLSDNDQRLLVDVAGRLPGGVYLRLAYSTYTQERAAQIRRLLAVGDSVREWSVMPLTPSDIADWLETAGQPRELAEPIFTVTAGYPLDIGDAVNYLTATGEIGIGDVSQRFQVRTLEAWDALDVISRAAASQLAAFDRPLPEEWLQTACALSPAGWTAVVDTLVRARILSTTVNGVPWFHPRRQAVILENLRETDRALLTANAEQAITAYLEYSKAVNDPSLTAEIAAVAEAEPAVLEGDPQLQTIADLSPGQLSVLAALVEMHEPKGLPLLASDVLQHARDFFVPDGDLLPALKDLVELGLVAAQTNPYHGDMLHLLLDGDAALALIQGRTLRELGRLPLPGLASSIFSLALRPRLEPFVNVVYGLGPGTLRVHVEQASVLGRAPGLPFLARGQGEFLIMRGYFHDRPISATVRFASSEDRNSARSRLDGLSSRVLGGPFSISELIDHPAEAIAADRFVGTVERVLGGQMNRAQKLTRSVDAMRHADSYMAARVNTFATLASRCDEWERRAFGLEQAPAIHWHVDTDSSYLIQAETYGGEPRSVRHEQLPAMDERFGFFSTAEAFGLSSAERLLRINHQAPAPFADDPVVGVIEEVRQKARHVTRHQRQVKVEIEPASLQVRLERARSRELEDARALVESGVFDDGTPQPEPLATYVCLHQTEHKQRGFRSRLTFSCLVVHSCSGVEEVHVSDRPSPGMGGREQLLELWGDVFGTPITGEFVYFTNSDATIGVADLIGYNPDDIVLIGSDGRPAEAW